MFNIVAVEGERTAKRSKFHEYFHFAVSVLNQYIFYEDLIWSIHEVNDNVGTLTHGEQQRSIMIEWIKEQGSVGVKTSVLEAERNVKLFGRKHIAINQILFELIGGKKESAKRNLNRHSNEFPQREVVTSQRRHVFQQILEALHRKVFRSPSSRILLLRRL